VPVGGGCNCPAAAVGQQSGARHPSAAQRRRQRRPAGRRCPAQRLGAAALAGGIIAAVHSFKRKKARRQTVIDGLPPDIKAQRMVWKTIYLNAVENDNPEMTKLA
jgi:hypothetical protein